MRPRTALMAVLMLMMPPAFASCRPDAIPSGGTTPAGTPTAEARPNDQAQASVVFDDGFVTAVDADNRRFLVARAAGDPPQVRAAWFRVAAEAAAAFETVALGRRVRVWSREPLRESLPEQGLASKIEILPDAPAPDGWVSRQAAVAAALADAGGAGADSRALLAVADAVLALEEQLWTVRLVRIDDALRVTEVSVDAADGRIIRLKNQAFRIFEPRPSDAVGSSFVVRGKARVFEATFNWELEDGHNLLASGHEMTDAGAPGWGNFAFQVRYEQPTNAHLGLILFVHSAKDGSRDHELILPLKAADFR
ncbi:MAG: hypothetical protein BLM47_10830 [Candidatus Reconcilbacillus cellulovorans]|uniref:Bacterial spore germination immunoglobulin-like domain-containing protein n=1 Tax=Candidatus Reconcilbacillus cellulovorans TaxID=1906605 RepID=A0A2A6DY03_9BACL|nr:MAG: hypothetical protein BLM47_10830 [Candidatus Reconcilbacillus cellulovorans]